MSLHELCTMTLNHEITQALACGQKIGASPSKKLLANFGLLHFLVVSGAHFNMLIRSLTLFGLIGYRQVCALLIFVAMCNFAPPVLRVWFFHLSRIQLTRNHIFAPTLVLHMISYVLGIFFFYNKSPLLFSLNLSFVFSLILFLSPAQTTLKGGLCLYLTASPFLMCLFGNPHISSLVLTPFTAVFLNFFLLPGSLASLFSNQFEFLSIEMWWLYKSLLESISIFFNHPNKFYLGSNLISNTKLIVFNMSFFISTAVGVIFWRRRSYSFH